MPTPTETAFDSLLTGAEPAIIVLFRNHHLRHLRLPDTNMDNLRESFSGMKKGIKRRLKGSKRKADKTGTDGRGETVADPSGSLPRPGPPAVVTGGDREQKGNEPDPNAGHERAEPSAPPDEKKSDWKSTASASAKLLLRGVRDSADAFGPLKALAGGLCFILENCDVWSPSPNATHNAHRPAAYEGKQTSHRIIGTSGQSACRTAL